MRPFDPRLLRYARATRVHLTVTVALGVVTALLIIAQADLLSRGIARVVTDGVERTALSTLFAGLAAVVGGRALVVWFQDGAAQRSAAVVKSQLRSQLVARVATAGPGASAARAEVATLATRGIDALDGYFGQYLPQLALAVIVPVVVLARIAVADVTATVIIAVTLPLIPVFMMLVGRATETANAKRWDALTRLSHHFLDVVSGFQTLKVFGRARAQAESVRTTTDRYRTTTMATLRVAFLSSLVLELLATLSVALVAVSVGLRLVDGGLDLRVGLLVITLAPEAYLPLRQVGARYHAAAEGLAAAAKTFEILDQPVTGSGTDRDVPDMRRNGTLEVDSLSVSHPGRSESTPDAVHFVARLGEITVIVGPSGAGKTTLLSVLLGARRPTTGTVVVSGDGRRVALHTLDTDSWRAQLAWADQSPYLFAGSVADNVRLARPDATDAMVRGALDAAGLTAMETDRVVREAGAGLSAGERRRVALARTVLRDAPLVLLDEPTAGLDAETELDVLATIARIATNSIVVMVSHRPAAIAIADHVVELGRPTASPGQVRA